MYDISKTLKAYIYTFIFISLIIIGLIITLTNLSLTFKLSVSSKNQNAVSAMENLNGFPKGLILISMKKVNEFTENDVLRIIEWLDDKGKSKSEISLHDNDRITINLNYINNYDLSNYLNKLFLIPNVKIKNLKIINKEELIVIDILLN